MPLSKRALKRRRSKLRKKELRSIGQKFNNNSKQEKLNKNSSDDISYVSDKIFDDESQIKYFEEVFKKFATPEMLTNKIVNDNKEINNNNALSKKDNKQKIKNTDTEDDEDDSEDEDEDNKINGKDKISNKKKKLRDRLTVSQLKQVVERPDLVEIHDPNSADPTLLIHLKSYRNTVPVPSHWSEKRKYLQGKRGIVKAPFQLPKAIQDTGIGEIRDHQQNRDANKSMKQKQRQRINPKMGKIDIDYQKLHSAFFKHIEKPKMSNFGDLYYMGKEFEVKYRRHKPGMLSKRLMNALHIQDGAPPPYLINMQRFGPPPSYPDLKIPGLNSPIPIGCKYGYGEGQWGKPPVNENGYPLYGDPFGMNSKYEIEDIEPKNYELFGTIEENLEYEEDEMEEEVEEISIKNKITEQENDEISSGIDSIPKGFETPPVLPIRKDNSKISEKNELYKVLDKKETNIDSKTAFGTTHIYKIDSEKETNKHKNSKKSKMSKSTSKSKKNKSSKHEKRSHEYQNGDKVEHRSKTKDDIDKFKF